MATPSKPRKALFLHLQKTGGNAVLDTLRGTPGARVETVGHGTLQHAHDFYHKKYKHGETWEELYKFGFARNPWDRMVSFYHHEMKGTKRIGKEGQELYDDFRDWLCYQGMMRLGRVCARTMFTTWMGDCEMNFVGRYEHLAHDLGIVAEALGIEPGETKLSNVGQRPGRAYQDYYDKRTHSMIVGTCDWEIATFRYTFYDEPTPIPTARPVGTNASDPE